MFEVYNFADEQSKPKRGRPRKERPGTIKDVLSFAIGWRRTVVGCVNLRLVGNAAGTVITVSPQRFASIWPEAGAKATSGVVYLTAKHAEELGFTFAREIEEVIIA
ncbi:hypothetical protein ACFYU8_31185 [Brevibacillus sp. NPDC003359]|uniref:hypothetical protein n=1 Tax=unclassified Brevibacillus TaxID=2684853 RepID=UPI003684835C